MDAAKLYRVAHAAQACDVNRSTLVTAVRAGQCPSVATGCGLPLVTLADVRAWAKVDRRPGRPASKSGAKL